jgi:hypothetical protein
VDEHVDGAGGRRGGDVDRPQAMPGRQQQLGGAHVLADRAHVLVGRDGGAQLRARGVVVVDMLAHDDGIEASGIGSPVSSTT